MAGTIRALVAPVIASAALLLALPPWLYRWSIKGTSLLLAPLAFLVSDARTTEPKHVAESRLMGQLLNGANAILLCALGRVAQFATGQDFGLLETYRSFVAAKDPHGVLQAFFPADSTPAWQLLLVLCALVTFVLVHYATRLKSRGHTPDQALRIQNGLILLGGLAVVLIFSLIFTSARLA